MWESVELREIRTFLVLADELHFGRTAESLGLSQSRVSQVIRELEAKLGGPLFHRTSRRVELTAAGERLVHELRGPFDALAGALRHADADGRAVAGQLRLTLISPSAGGPHMLDIVAAFEERYPDCRVGVDDLGDWVDVLRPLRRGEIDLMANRLPLAEPDIVVGPVLSREERVVAVARNHPLARRSSITLEDLADHRVARIEAWTPEQAEGACPSHAPSGRRIRRTRESPTNFAALLRMVAVGEAVHPTVPSLGDFAGRPDVVFVPLAGLPPAESALILRRGPSSRRLQAFVDVARQVLPPELSRPAVVAAA